MPVCPFFLVCSSSNSRRHGPFSIGFVPDPMLPQSSSRWYLFWEWKRVKTMDSPSKCTILVSLPPPVP